MRFDVDIVQIASQDRNDEAEVQSRLMTSTNPAWNLKNVLAHIGPLLYVLIS